VAPVGDLEERRPPRGLADDGEGRLSIVEQSSFDAA